MHTERKAMPEETPKPANAGGVSPAAVTSGTPPPKRHWWPVVAIIILVLVIGGLFWRLVSRKPKAAPPTPPVMVSTAKAEKGDMGIYVDGLLGLVTPLATVAVPSQVSGQLMKVNYTEGQMVKAGDVLAEIDPRPFQAALDSAEGTLERDEALLAEARLDLKRYQDAYEQKAIPKQQLDNQGALVAQDEGTVKFDQGQVAN